MDTLYGILALPPTPLKNWIERFQERHGLAAYGTPHLNLRSPFLWSGTEASLLTACQQQFAHLPPLELQLGGWERFSSTVFIGVKPNPLLEHFHQAALRLPHTTPSSLDAANFVPHITVALGICPWAFRRMWREVTAEHVPSSRWRIEELYIAKDNVGELEIVGSLELARLVAASD
jgi:2'-5' RNA ligase